VTMHSLGLLSYLVAAGLCLVCAGILAGRERSVWIAIACVLAALAANREWNFHELITAWGREFAMEQGWYGRRRLIQGLLILWLLLLASMGWSRMFRWVQSVSLQAQLACVGGVLLITFVTVKAVSLHQVDSLLRKSWHEVTVNTVLEACGIAWVAWAAFWRWRQCAREKRRPPKVAEKRTRAW
jgi:hypothetical protein